MPRDVFHEQLERLEEALQEQGQLVLRALRSSVNALYRRDVDLADEVIAFDDEVDHRYHSLQQGIEGLLALQTPSQSTCASCWPCCTSISTSSAWAITA